MPNDDVAPTATQEFVDMYHQLKAAIDKAQLDPMYRHASEDELADPGLNALRLDDEGDSDDGSEPSDENSNRYYPSDVRCQHCHRLYVTYIICSRSFEDLRVFCDNCGPLQCNQCETTLKSRSGDIPGSGPELYCPYCDLFDQVNGIDELSYDERNTFHGYPDQLTVISPFYRPRIGKTVRDRQDLEEVRQYHELCTKPYFVQRVLVNPHTDKTASMPARLLVQGVRPITKTRFSARIALLEDDEITKDCPELNPSKFVRMVLDTRRWYRVRLSVFDRNGDAVMLAWVNFRGNNDLVTYFKRASKVNPRRAPKFGIGRLSGIDRRALEELNARPTSDTHPIRTRKRDFYAPRPEDLRDGRKPIRPWTRQQRGVLMADERLLHEPEPRQAHPDQPTDLELENEARGIVPTPRKPKYARSTAAARGNTDVFRTRPPTKSLADVEKRTVDPRKDEPMYLRDWYRSKLPLTTKLGRVLLHWPRSH